MENAARGKFTGGEKERGFRIFLIMNTTITDSFIIARRYFIALLFLAVSLLSPLAALDQSSAPKLSADPVSMDAFISTVTLPAPETIQYTDKAGQSCTSFAFPGQVVVLMDKSVKADAAGALFQARGGKVISQIPTVGIYIVQVGSGKEGTFISAVNSAAGVEEAFPNMSLPVPGLPSWTIDLVQHLDSVFSLYIGASAHGDKKISRQNIIGNW